MYVGGGQAVHQGRTFVRVAATWQLRPPGADICVSAADTAPGGHLYVSQRQLQLSVQERYLSMSCGLQVYITSLQKCTKCTKIFKKNKFFLVILRIDFFKNL